MLAALRCSRGLAIPAAFKGGLTCCSTQLRVLGAVAPVMAATAAAPARGMASFRDRKKRVMKKAMAQANERQEDDIDIPELKEMRLARDSTGVIADPWVPKLPSDRPSLFSTEGLKYRWQALKKAYRSTISVGIMRFSKCKDFRPDTFAPFGQEMFVAMQEALARQDKHALRDYVTADAYLTLKKQFPGKHDWVFVEELERPRVVHVNLFPVENKDNLFAQVTVRFKIRQVGSQVSTGNTSTSHTQSNSAFDSSIVRVSFAGVALLLPL
eukprot:m.151257 g.151257  ORF g.151257 m.151257 type:complete len:269 (+) comp17406_c0_seq4:95-901(+)